MSIHWNEKSADWLERASAYTGFHKKLAEMIRPYVCETGNLCDLGCGSGLIDTELTPAGGITCVDINSSALQQLEILRKRRELPPVRTLNADARCLSGKWDTVLTVFHGSSIDFSEKYLKLTRGNLISVVHRLAPGRSVEYYHNPKTNTAEKTIDMLSRLGVKHIYHPCELEYGQPFKSYAEAMEFVRVYQKNPPGMSVGDYLSRCLERTGKPNWPLYLPNKKYFGIFVMGKAAEAFHEAKLQEHKFNSFSEKMPEALVSERLIV